MSNASQDMRTPRAKVEGLGGAKHGTDHFWVQRLTAAAMIPLAIWFVWSLASHAGDTRAELAAWLSSPLAAAPLLLLILVGFHHMQIGMQVVIEDYIHRDGTKIVLIFLNKAFAAVAGLVSVLSVLRLAIAG